MGAAIYVKSKIDGNEYCKTNGQFTRHLKSHDVTYQTYYEKYVSGVEMKCLCGKSMTFYQASDTYANSCGSAKCVGRTVAQTKQNWTVEQKNTDSVNKKKWAASRTKEDLAKSRELRKQTNRDRYGVDYTTQSSHMMTKSKLTKKERYGNEYYANSKQTSESWQAKTADELNKITEKSRATCLERYGVSSPFFLPGVRKKSAISNGIGREFILPSGKLIRVRGYEDIAITELLKKYSEIDIVVDDMLSAYALPTFNYVNVNIHTSVYHPDIFIPDENKIIEIKGRWWWDGNGLIKHSSRLLNNLKKREAVLAAGYQYEVWLFEDRKHYRILTDGADFITE